mgnify:CR=1 FL=1
MKDQVTIAPFTGHPTRCQALFHGDNGQCPEPAAWTVTYHAGPHPEPADLCETHAAPYRAQPVTGNP